MHLSVVMPTRNRGGRIVPAVESVLRQAACDFELVLIDQSTDDAAAAALQASGLASARRLVYQRSETVGISRARNEGIARSRGEIVAFTDDDCLVPPDWLDAYAELLEREPAADIAFGPLIAAQPEKTSWTPEFHPVKEGFVSPSGDVKRSLGLGANFVARRRVLEAVGPFDPVLGTGSVFGAGEDTDFAYRALRLGYRVYITRRPAVQHFGLRKGNELIRARRAYTAGMVAMAMKHVRCGDLRMMRPVLDVFGKGVRDGTRRILNGQRPSGYRMCLWVMQSIAASLRFGVDREHQLYRTAPARGPRPGLSWPEARGARG
jgi:glycosyltransferase involved in cell wall biosynthesis